MDGLKARLSFDAVAYDYDDEYLTIDTDTHTININNVFRLFGVQYDGNSKLIKFRVRNKLSDIQKMQDSIVYINWIDSRGVKGQSIAINKTINNDTCEFAWKVPFDALKNSGVLHFAMSAVVTKNSSSVIDQRWSTQIASVITPDGIYIKSYTPSSEEEDRIAQIYNELSNMINKQNDNLQSQVNLIKEDLSIFSKSDSIDILKLPIDSSAHGELSVNIEKNSVYLFILDSIPTGALNFFTENDYSSGYLGDAYRFTKNSAFFAYHATKEINKLYIMCYGEIREYTVLIKKISSNEIPCISMRYFPKLISESDDTKRIQRGINACRAIGVPCTLEMEPIRYMISDSLTLNKCISIEGNECCIYVSDPKMKNTMMIYPNESNTDGYSAQLRRIRFDGGNAKHKVDGLWVALSNVKIYNCRFSNLNVGYTGDAISDLIDCGIYDNKIGLLINYSESCIINLHGNSKIGISLAGEGNRIIGCKLHGDGPKTESNCGIYLTGTRNIIEDCYIDQWKVAGIIIDSSKKNFIPVANKEIGGPYQNIISGNYFFNNGSGEFDESLIENPNHPGLILASAGIVLRTVPKTSKSTIEDNSIIGNNFGTGYFKGWNEENTAIIATKTGIHLCGNANNTIFNNLIALNKFDSNIENKILYYNSTKEENTVEINV